MQTRAQSSHTRIDAFDAVRVFALFGGVVLHATISFLPPTGHTIWPITDVSSSRALALVFYAIHPFRMVAFFLLAGFFARMLVTRDGVVPFLRNRMRRILAPFVVGWLALFPVTYAAFAWAHVRATGGPIPRPVPWLMHLWFLLTLLWLYFLLLALRWGILTLMDAGRARRGSDRVSRAIVRGRLGAGLLVAPLAAALWWTPGWAAWFGIPAPGLIPGGAAFVAYGSAMALGWLLHRQPDLLRVWERRCWWYISGGVVCTAAALALIGSSPVYEPAERDARTGLYAVLYAAAAWLGTFALIGACLRWFAFPGRTIRYLADASYWSYLIHLPVVIGLQSAVMSWPVFWPAKFALVLTTTLIVILASYHLLVRTTALGRMLNGHRRVASRQAWPPGAAPAGLGGRTAAL